jgi:hypothetical protein
MRDNVSACSGQNEKRHGTSAVSTATAGPCTPSMWAMRPGVTLVRVSIVCGLKNAGDEAAISAKSLPLTPTNTPVTKRKKTQIVMRGKGNVQKG